MGEHTAAINDVRFSPDGKTIASGSDDRTIKLWNLDGQLLKTLEGHIDGVSLVRFNPDGKTLASASTDKSIRLWNLGATKNTQFLSKLSGSIFRVSFSQAGKIAVLANDDPKVWLYDLKGNWINTLSKHYDAVLSADFRANGQQIATGSADGYLRVLDVSGKQAPLRWLATEQTLGSYTTSGIYVDKIENSPFLTVTGVDFDSPAAKAGVQVEDHIVEINGGSTVGMTRQDAYGLLDSQPGKNASLRLDRGGIDITLSVDQEQVKWYASITSVAFSPKSALIASGGEDGFVTLWNTTGKRLSKQKSGGTITGLSFSPDGKRFASVSTNETIMLWDSDEQSKSFGQKIWEGRHKKSVLAVTFSPDGQTIASGSEDRTIKLWSLKGKELISLPKTASNAQEGHDGRVVSVAFSPDGKMIVSASEDKTVKLWNVNNGNLLTTFYGHSAPIAVVRVEPDGQTITSIGVDGSIIHWRPADLELDALFRRGCSWLHDYLSNVSDTPDSSEDRNLCAEVDVQKQP